jgi:hypothetical protein
MSSYYNIFLLQYCTRKCLDPSKPFDFIVRNIQNHELSCRLASEDVFRSIKGRQTDIFSLKMDIFSQLVSYRFAKHVTQIFLKRLKIRKLSRDIWIINFAK